MNTRKSSHKKAYRFEALSEAVEEGKATKVIESSSIMVNNKIKSSDSKSDLKESFLAIQNKTSTAQFCNIG